MSWYRIVLDPNFKKNENGMVPTSEGLTTTLHIRAADDAEATLNLDLFLRVMCWRPAGKLVKCRWYHFIFWQYSSFSATYVWQVVKPHGWHEPVKYADKEGLKLSTPNIKEHIPYGRYHTPNGM